MAKTEQMLRARKQPVARGGALFFSLVVLMALAVLAACTQAPPATEPETSPPPEVAGSPSPEAEVSPSPGQQLRPHPRLKRRPQGR